MFKRWPAWRWSGLNRHGLQLRGLAFVPPQVLRMQLWQQGVHLKSTRKIQQPTLRGKRLAQWHLAFTKSWASLLSSGITQLDALQLLSNQAQHAQVADWLHNIQQSLQGGAPLHQSVAQCGAGFSQQYCQLIEVGEHSGQLSVVLERLCGQAETRLAQAQAIRKALSYPCIVLAVALSVVVAMLYFIVPQFVDMYAQMGAEIPASTAYLMSFSAALRQPQSWLVLSSPLLLIPVIRYLAQAQSQHVRINRALYRIPWLGSQLSKQHLLYDVATLQLAYASAMPLTDACQLTARSSLSASFKSYWQNCARLLAGGVSLHEILQQNPHFDGEALQRVRLGEQSGRLSEQLEYLTQSWRRTLEARQQNFIKALEPAFLVLTGSLTAGILLALYVPLFQLGQLVG